MPARTQQHIIAERAMLAVSKVVADAGFAVETIQRDYGEDLLVQTSHKGEMDASRLWLQIKGTSQITRFRSSHGFSCKVQMSHAVRWARTADPVVVILWDIKASCGYYALVPRGVRSWGDVGTRPRTVTIDFSPEHLFDVKSMSQLAWQSRLERYTRLLMEMRVEMEVSVDMDLDGDCQAAETPEKKGLWLYLALDLLEELGVVHYRGDDVVEVDSSSLEQIATHVKGISDECPSSDEEDVKGIISMAIVSTIVERASDLTPDGIGTDAMLAASHMLLTIFESKGVFDQVVA
jgi:uncharacterized protein DUF4365